MTQPSRRKAPPNSQWRRDSDALGAALTIDTSQVHHEVIASTPEISSSLWDSLISRPAIGFLRGKPFDDQPEKADQWHVKHYFGAGSFGRAALWEKKDTEGLIVDEIVIKEVAPT